MDFLPKHLSIKEIYVLVFKGPEAQAFNLFFSRTS